MKNILVIGGTVFLSREIAILLISQNYNVDILTRGFVPLDYSGFNEHLICDRRNKNEMLQVLKNKSYDIIIDVCVYAKRDIEIVLKSLSTKPQKYIMCSTCSVYKLSNGEKIGANTSLISENSTDKYALRKLEAEKALMKSGIDFCIIRPTYIYGERNQIPRESLIFDAILHNKPLYLPKEDYIMNLVYVKDLARIFANMVEAVITKKIIRAFHPEEISFCQYIAICEEIAQKKAVIQRIDTEYCLKFPYLFQDIVFDNNEIEQNIYQPDTCFFKGMTSYFKWYMAQ